MKCLVTACENVARYAPCGYCALHDLELNAGQGVRRHYRDPVVKVKRLRRGVKLPQYQTAGASGLDLAAAEEREVRPGGRVRVPTGIAIQLPDGYEAQVRPRSGMSYQHGLVAVLGTVDRDYTGEIGVLICNIDLTPKHIEVGMRIGQLVICPVATADLVEVRDLDATERGAKGWGSSGVGGGGQ